MVSTTTHTSRPRAGLRACAAIGARLCTRGFSAPVFSSAAITSSAARSGSVASIIRHSTFGDSCARTSCTHVGDPATPKFAASAANSAALTDATVFDLRRFARLGVNLDGILSAAPRTSAMPASRLDLVEAFVALALGDDPVALEIQLAHAGDLRDAQ